MQHIVIGIRGQIGTCVKSYLLGVGEVEVIGVDMVGGRDEEVYKMVDGEMGFSGEMERVMHVCIPFVSMEGFCASVVNYMSRYRPKYVIIYSTVLPGTCDRLGDNVCHSPVEGRHPDLYGGFVAFRRMVGGKCSREVGEMFRRWGKKDVITFEDAKVTELGKMLSTTRYGINIMFADVERQICEQFGLKFEDVVLGYQRMYNEGYRKLGEDRFIQSLITPPVNGCGGHCVVPNAILLSKVTKHQWIDDLSHFNDSKGE